MKASLGCIVCASRRACAREPIGTETGTTISVCLLRGLGTVIDALCDEHYEMLRIVQRSAGQALPARSRA